VQLGMKKHRKAEKVRVGEHQLALDRGGTCAMSATCRLTKLSEVSCLCLHNTDNDLPSWMELTTSFLTEVLT
jgi:hypothetical protein